MSAAEEPPPEPPDQPATPPQVVLVDGQDNALGLEDRADCHALPGRKHRAFTALVLGADGRVLLARRAAEKPLWPGSWDGTVASHPAPGEGYAAAGERRLVEELGASCSLYEHGRFDYEVPFEEIGVENELCCTLVGKLAADADLQPTPSEISELRWVAAADLASELAREPEQYCPWLYLALLCLGRCRRPLPAELDALLEPLRGPPVEALLLEGLAAHFDGSAGGSWSILDGGEDAA